MSNLFDFVLRAIASPLNDAYAPQIQESYELLLESTGLAEDIELKSILSLAFVNSAKNTPKDATDFEVLRKMVDVSTETIDVYVRSRIARDVLKALEMKAKEEGATTNEAGVPK